MLPLLNVLMYGILRHLSRRKCKAANEQPQRAEGWKRKKGLHFVHKRGVQDMSRGEGRSASWRL